MRYYIVEDEDGWQVVDAWTLDVAKAGGCVLHGLPFLVADELAELLSQGMCPTKALQQLRGALPPPSGQRHALDRQTNARASVG